MFSPRGGPHGNQGIHESQRQACFRGGRGAHPPRHLYPREPAADRNPRRLRHRPVRRLHRADERPRHQELLDCCNASRGRRAHDHRGRGEARRHAAPDAAGLQGKPRAAMRLLHAGDGDERARFREKPPQSDRAGSAREPRGEPVPVHRLPQHREEHHGRGASDGREDMNAPLIGARVLRKEDYRFLTGTGQYTDDVALPNQSYAAFVRSPHAHAVLKKIDAEKAKKAPGVLAVYTGEDLAAAKVGGLPCGWLITDVNGKPMKEPPYPPLAQGKVRHVGEKVAVVIAETLAQARDAADKIKVDYEELPAVVELAKAKKGPAIHEIAPDNTCYVWALGDKAAIDAAFAKAAHVTKLEIVNNRLIPNAIEPRAANATYSRAEDGYTLYVASQNPHVERLLMTAFVLGLPESKVRVVAPDVGGGFGSKIYLYPEDVVVTWAAKKLNRPVKWTAERSEAYVSDAHGRDHLTTAELALDQDGKFLAMRVKTAANMGAYLSTFASCIPTILYATLLAGQYTTPLIYCEVTAIFTNTTPVDAYRGAGRPEDTYVVERLVETAAREMKMAPVEIRRKNFIREFPYQTPVALCYDTGDYDATLDAALKLADVSGYAKRKEDSARKGKLRGIGYVCYIEACGIAPSNVAGSLGARAGLFEAGEIRVHPTGTVTVFTGSHQHGQ